MDLLLENFHFLRPLWFLLLLPLIFLVYMLLQKKKSLGVWQKLCDPELLNYLKVGETAQSSLWSLWVFALIGILAITALAGPVWQKMPQPVYKQQSALVILFDVSRSMNAADIKPSRLIRAKQKIDDLLKLRHEGQTALVAFAGTAYVVTPLTEDSETILSQLDGLTPDIMPKQGSNIDAALQQAIKLFSQASVLHGQVLLFTDSDYFSKEQVQQLTAAGHDLSVIGVGTTSGAPIPQAGGGFLTDQRGNIVVPQLHESRLQDLAKLGQGIYKPLTLDNSDIQPTLSRFERQQWKGEQKETMQNSDQWREQGPWLLLAIIPLVLMGFRRGLLAVALCLWLQPSPVYAGVWQDLWQTKDQQAQTMMAKKQFDRAAQTFEDPAWQASAAYRNSDYENALKALESIDEPTTDDLYNKGNALAQLGRLDEAAQAFDEVLQKDAGHEDAKVNKALVEKMKQEQDSKENQESEQDKSEQDESQQDKLEQDKSEQGDSSQDKGEQGQQSQDANNQEQSEQSDQDNQEAEQEQDSKSEQEAEQQQAKQAESKQTEAEQEKPETQEVQQQKRSEDDLEKQEAQQAFEQALRRVPDDPSGLLRRKFLYQYQRQESEQNQGQGQQGAGQW